VILVVGATPTVQRTMFFAQALAPGAVNRAREVHVSASGKAVNVARVVTLVGGAARLVHSLGGDTGRFVARALDAENVPQEVVWAQDDAPTRTCTTLLPNVGPATELVEEARPLAESDVAALEAATRRHLPEARALCLSGSLPPGVPDDFYAALARAAREAGVPVVVDAQRAPLHAALAARPFLVKPNREEALATLGLTSSGDAGRDAERGALALTEAGAQWALVSLGAGGSLLVEGTTGRRWQVVSPTVEAVNPIGSGDSLAAGLLVAHLRGADVPEAVRYGTACAAANCLTPTSGVVRPGDVEALLPQVRLTPLP